ncbi:hypothetical protein, conserved [Angomonas deanei]|uniref:Uncharacterized protein n=1 Tax=Angomonas deanei TaxID=59799 RepID=A0A7G2C474_9TRYP|nr:hypothetical protein, conserved [Angomonas deanei]
MKCPADAEETKEVLNSDCKLYREQCPSYACGDGYRLDGVDYGCYKKQTQVDEKKGMSGGKVAGLSIGMFVLGALLAAAIVFLYWRRRYRRAFASFTTPVFLDEVMVTKAQ